VWAAGDGLHADGGDTGTQRLKGLSDLGRRGRGPRGTQGVAYLGRGGAADGRRRPAMAAGSVRKGRRCSGVEEVTVRG
jgi:hypothetical protein